MRRQTVCSLFESSTSSIFRLTLSPHQKPPQPAQQLLLKCSSSQPPLSSPLPRPPPLSPAPAAPAVASPVAPSAALPASTASSTWTALPVSCLPGGSPLPSSLVWWLTRIGAAAGPFDSASSFTSTCAKVGKEPGCCLLGLAGLALVCNPPAGV